MSLNKNGIKVLGIAAAALLLLVPLMAQTQQQLAIAQANPTEQTVAQVSPPHPQPSPLARTPDNIFAEIEGKLPGFAGLFFDSEGKLNVYVTQPDGVTSAQIASVLADYLEPTDMEKGITILQAKHTWNTWKAWKQTSRELMFQQELGVTKLDIDEKNQKIVIGFIQLDEGTRAKVNEFLVANNIPLADVELVETGPINLLSHGVTVSPRKGGIEIGYSEGSNNYVCTNGFIANRQSDGIRVSATAGHCEGVVDTAGDESYVQPSGGSTVGTEVANTNLAGPRYSDSLLWAPSSGITTSLGKIYNGGSDYTITGKKNFHAVGEYICKYGRTTHESCGSITNVDVDYTHPNYSQLWSQNEVSLTAQGGDSGSPVFKKGTNPNVTLYGILWGVGSVAVYSPIYNVEIDQGTLQVN